MGLKLLEKKYFITLYKWTQNRERDEKMKEGILVGERENTTRKSVKKLR